MATAGYSGTPLPKKLGIKPGHRVGVIGDPGHVHELLEDAPPGVRILTVRRGSPSYDVILLFAPDARTLQRQFARAKEGMDVDGGLWIAWPKKSSPMHVDLAEGQVRTLGLQSGLVDNKICAVDADWSGLRFVYRVEDRPALRQALRQA